MIISFGKNDYIDKDVAYLLGLIIGRGTLSESQGMRQIKIEFSYSSLKIQGISRSYDQQTSIQLGLNNLRERLLELLDTDIKIVKKASGFDFVIRFMRNNLIWRDILLFVDESTNYPFFRIPTIFFNPELPIDWKREFVRGYADVAGNIREANRYVDGRHRVRLDVLNYSSNWEVPVQICNLLQEYLEVPVQLITWGHPNMGREFREHQINIFAQPFLKIGFSFEHKQKILEEFAEWDNNNKGLDYNTCPGKRLIRVMKAKNPDENNCEKLDEKLVGSHFDSYWQICKALGCSREPPPDRQMKLEFIEEI